MHVLNRNSVCKQGRPRGTSCTHSIGAQYLTDYLGARKAEFREYIRFAIAWQTSNEANRAPSQDQGPHGREADHPVE